MLVGGALVNSLAFSGSNFLFSLLRNKGVDEERKRHDKAVENLHATQVAWARKRQKRLDWINEELRRQGHAVHTFQDVDEAIRQYNLVTGKVVAPDEPKPMLSDFYVPSDGQKDCEVAFVVLGLGATALVAYELSK